ncbi:MAG: SCO1664 family protein [Chloroflexota bacterium]|nr:SCO1664 family protein [Chloroflexota bacterium]
MNTSSFPPSSDFDDFEDFDDFAELADDSELAGALADQDDCTQIQLLESDVLETLRTGKIEEKGLLPYSSNTSFLIVVNDGQRALPAVYKPQRGENPLWDFEWGTLCRRETAAYAISSALEWDLVPPTVLRDGTRGTGSIQFYIDHDPNTHYFTVQSDARFATSFRQLMLFDFLINNADRKSGHCLIGSEQRVWAIDHGICFHTEYKLRTVIWEFSGEPLESELLEDLVELRRGLKDRTSRVNNQICQLLATDECTALLTRLDYLIRKAVYPNPPAHRRNYPWPPV